MIKGRSALRIKDKKRQEFSTNTELLPTEDTNLYGRGPIFPTRQRQRLTCETLNAIPRQGVVSPAITVSMIFLTSARSVVFPSAHMNLGTIASVFISLELIIRS